MLAQWFERTQDGNRGSRKLGQITLNVPTFCSGLLRNAYSQLPNSSNETQCTIVLSSNRVNHAIPHMFAVFCEALIPTLLQLFVVNLLPHRTFLNDEDGLLFLLPGLHCLKVRFPGSRKLFGV